MSEPRTFVVGDVHGCADELEDLLDRVDFTEGDRLVMVGDLVVRGPHPRRVVEIVRRCGGLSVRGNHEDRLLRFRELSAGHREPRPDEQRLFSNESLRRTAADLDEAAWTFLEGVPLWLDLDDHALRIVHAGLVPGRPIEGTSERALMYMRTIGPDGEPSARRGDGPLWGTQYTGPPHVCFGHNAMFEPQLHRWATGLDTGCVYGGALTALALEAGEPVPARPADRHLYAVTARQTYHPID